MFVMIYIHGMNLSAFDLNLLVALDALLTERSVTRAARRLGLSQPAMSNALARLRSALSDPVLVRASNRMVPTRRAEGLSAPVRDALSIVERALAGSVFDPMVARRTFTVAASDHREMHLIPRLMARLAKEAPGVRVCVIPPARGADPTGLLESDGADMAVMKVEAIRPPLRAEEWFREPFVCISRRAHPRLRGGLTLASYAALPHVVVAPYGTPGSFVDVALAKAGKSRDVAVRVSSFSAAPVIVAASDCIATVPSSVAHQFLGWLRLQVYEPPLALPETPIGAVWHRRVDDDPGHRWFRAVLASIGRAARPSGSSPRSKRRARV
jgi:DNA-binding transcriptional LysR family regulator